MKLLKSIIHGVDSVSDWSGKTLSFLILFLMVIIAIDVTMRTAFNTPIHWVFETVTFIFGGVSVLAGAYVLRHRAHVSMDALYSRFSPRGKACANLATSLLFFLFCGVLLWTSWNMAWRSLELSEHTTTSWAPLLYPIKMTIPVACVMLILQRLAQLVREVVMAVTGKEWE